MRADRDDENGRQQKFFFVPVLMHYQIIPYLSKQWNFSRPESYVVKNSLLQFPSFMLMVVMSSLKAASGHNFEEWNRLKGVNITPPKPSAECDMKQAIRGFFNAWLRSGGVSMQNLHSTDFYVGEDYVKAIKYMISAPIISRLAPEESSLLLALLAETFYQKNFQTLGVREFVSIFNKQQIFMYWLQSSFLEYFSSFSCRVAFLFYVFESLRLDPRFLDPILYLRVWDPELREWRPSNPAAQLWSDLLEWNSRRVDSNSNSHLESQKPVAELRPDLLESQKPVAELRPDLLDSRMEKLESQKPVAQISRPHLELTGRSVGDKFLDFVKNIENNFEGGESDIKNHLKLWQCIMTRPIDTSALFFKAVRSGGTKSPDEIKRRLHSAFKHWHSYLIPRKNTAFCTEQHMLESIKILTTEAHSYSSCSSLVLSMLAEITTKELAYLFENHITFANWLNEVAGGSKRSLSGRIAYRYYVLETLRQLPALSKFISVNRGWESFYPAQEIWEAFLNSNNFTNTQLLTSTAVNTHDHCTVNQSIDIDIDQLVANFDIDQPTDFDESTNIDQSINYDELLTDFNELTSFDQRRFL
eukprot:Gregarina_sp_Poly_1__3343@NODE_1963_length_2989_cov_7_699521_g1264_i0_p1_GENE_NODE_1963_length_2989_cov_7_699521_g1264_i0NODE_1963_length_2989_cov_7_699521_g1264_i0_p1_ORF_typecomplete_len586_score78_18_NODE_1963_length_2989_cov_7_699521_g1264_i08732630